MQQLQKIREERKDKMHQKQARNFNEMYDQILNNILQNKTLKVEKSIPDPNSIQENNFNINHMISRAQKQNEFILNQNSNLFQINFNST